MMRQSLVLLGLLTNARIVQGFSSNLGITRIESRLEASVHHAKTPEFTVVDEDEEEKPYMPPDFTIEDDGDDSEDTTYRAKTPEFTVIDDDEDNKPYIPPEFTVEDDVDDNNIAASVKSKSSYKPPNFTVKHDDSSYSESPVTSVRGPKRKAIPSMKGTNWMQKNAKFSNEPEAVDEPPPSRFNRRDSPRDKRGPPNSRDGRGPPSSNFRKNFRATRVFVQGIPPGTSWQDLKDHFKVAGEVVFASVSVDMETGESRGHGIVQFEEPEMAQHAIQIMRDHPFNGSDLYVREDVQENKNGASMKPKGPTPPTKWKCANEDNAAYMDESEISAIRNLIKARDDARRRRKYDVSDRIREELKDSHGVFIDDRLHMWWTSVDGSKVPKSIHDIKGDGRWKLKPWRQIPTTPENDACVNPDMVSGFLNQRDISRREKDFRTADALLEEARTCPDGDLTLRIHDESRTWRVWTEAPPTHVMQQREERRNREPEEMRMSAAEQCIRIVEEHAPHKMGEIKMVLSKFKGREFQVLKRLKNQYEV